MTTWKKKVAVRSGWFLGDNTDRIWRLTECEIKDAVTQISGLIQARTVERITDSWLEEMKIQEQREKYIAGDMLILKCLWYPSGDA